MLPGQPHQGVLTMINSTQTAFEEVSLDQSREVPSTSTALCLIGQSAQRMIPCTRAKWQAARFTFTTPPNFLNSLILLLPRAFATVSRRGFPQPSCNHEIGGGEMNRQPCQQTCGNRPFPFAALPARTQAAVETEALHFQ
jgi:hypothetical protein